MKNIKSLLCLSIVSIILCACGSTNSKEAGSIVISSEPVIGESDKVSSEHKHKWDNPTYTWSEDHLKCTAKRICKSDPTHVEEETANAIRKVVTAPTYTSEGLARYTVVFENTAFLSQTYEETLERLVKTDAPKFNSDGKTVTYGYYPQTRITDETLLEELEENAEWLDYGYYSYQADYYAKVYSKPYSENYKFDDGTTIKKNFYYWFKYEPINWTILNRGSGRFLLVSNLLLDACKYSSANRNKYDDSTMRDYLNDTFYNRAFVYGNSYIKKTEVDNSAASTGTDPNQFECDNTEDFVFPLSYKEYISSDYGFEADPYASSSSRYCKTTEFARVNGAVISTTEGPMLNNGLYWTRSPNAGNKNYASYVDTDGSIGYDNNTSYSYLCVRPAITIEL